MRAGVVVAAKAFPSSRHRHRLSIALPAAILGITGIARGCCRNGAVNWVGAAPGNWRPAYRQRFSRVTWEA